MQNLTIQLLAVIIGSGILKIILGMLLGTGTFSLVCGIIVDIAVVGIIYFLLKPYRIRSFNKIMMLVGGITVLSILVDFDIVPGNVANLVILAVLGWMLFSGRFFGGGNSRHLR